MKVVCEKQRESIVSKAADLSSMKEELAAINRVVSVQREQVNSLSKEAKEAKEAEPSSSDTIKSLENSLAAQKSSRLKSEGTSNKRIAVLTGQNATLSRANSALSVDLAATMEQIESLVLDKDALTGRVEVLSERVEELEVDLETVEMEKGAAGICRTIKNVRRRWY